MSSDEQTSSTIAAANAASIEKAARILANGDLVGIPTETVYGLGARADDEAAVQKIYDTKGRPAINPLIIHVTTLDQAMRYGKFDERARGIAKAFWPGPLTLVVPLKDDADLAPQVTANLKTIAIRCPAHKVMRDILEQCDFPIAAPSANKSGTLSPTRAIHVAQSLDDAVELILADAHVNVGLESTILDLSNDTPTILREGALTIDDFAPYLEGIEMSTHESEKPKSPGQMLNHYAPNLPLRLRAVDVKSDEALLAFGSTKFMGIEGGGRADDLPDKALRNLSEAGDLEEAAANLYAMLHELDQSGMKGIAAMDIPGTGIGKAINDRLRRAAQS